MFIPVIRILHSFLWTARYSFSRVVPTTVKQNSMSTRNFKKLNHQVYLNWTGKHVTHYIASALRHMI